MRLHVLGIPHTRTSIEFSHCAFTQKVLKFMPMMKAQGYEIIHYGVGDEIPTGADEHVELMTREQQEYLLGHKHESVGRFVGDDANVETPCYKIFNRELSQQLERRVLSSDLVCMPFGVAHIEGVQKHTGTNVETGIGYPECAVPLRIYESYSWMSRIQGKEGREGSNYEWVIPNYFDIAEWKLGIEPRKYLVYMGRIAEIKGLNVIRAIAEHRPDLQIIMCGQGDPRPFLSKNLPNLGYHPPLIGAERSKVLGGAIAILAPSLFVEPFCGVTVEANLCGTPAITTDYGAFAETIIHRANGFRCHTLKNWLDAIKACEQMPDEAHTEIKNFACDQYSFNAIGPRYTHVFNQIVDLIDKGGWYHV